MLLPVWEGHQEQLFGWGGGETKKAERILGNSIIMLLCFSLVLTTFFMLYRRQVILAFGGSEATIGYAMEYLSIYLWGTIFVQCSIGLNLFITCQGQSRIAMISVLIGAGTNIILDPFLIFVLQMGAKGAALATVISQALSSIWIVSFLASKRSSIRIRKENLKPDLKIMGNIAALGIAPFIMQSTESYANFYGRYMGFWLTTGISICLYGNGAS